MSDALHQMETVSEGDTARETVIRLSVRGRQLPEEPESAILRIQATPVIEIPLTHLEDDDWYFRWTTSHFTSLPASATAYTGQVEVTFEDGSTAYFPTTGTLSIKVNNPI
jgi:hypothetical protein